MRFATISFLLVLLAAMRTTWACGDEPAQAPASIVPITEVSSAPALPMMFAERTLPDSVFAVLETREDGRLAIWYPDRGQSASF